MMIHPNSNPNLVHTDNDKDLETSIAAMRYSLAEAGGIVCMHDTAQAPNNGERLRKFLDDTWNFW